MPNCFQLFKKTEPNVACSFSKVDEEMRAALGVECHPTIYYGDWYYTLGLRIACGMTLDQIHKECSEQFPDDKASLAIIDWLNANYDTNTFVTRHKD